MSNKRSEYRLVSSDYKIIPLRKHQKKIYEVIQRTIPGHEPEMHNDCFTMNTLSVMEVTALTEALRRIEKLSSKENEKTTFTMFEIPLEEKVTV